MPEFEGMLILSALLFICLLPLGLGKLLARWIWTVLFYLVASPFLLWRAWRERKVTARRRRNYEILGRYVALLGNSSELLRYFRNLIENDIRERELQKLLEENVYRLKAHQQEQHKQELQQQLAEEQVLKQLAAEQQEILAQSRVSLEQIKFREQLLEQLYHKIRKKYDL